MSKATNLQDLKNAQITTGGHMLPAEAFVVAWETYLTQLADDGIDIPQNLHWNDCGLVTIGENARIFLKGLIIVGSEGANDANFDLRDNALDEATTLAILEDIYGYIGGGATFNTINLTGGTNYALNPRDKLASVDFSGSKTNGASSDISAGTAFEVVYDNTLNVADSTNDGLLFTMGIMDNPTGAQLATKFDAMVTADSTSAWVAGAAVSGAVAHILIPDDDDEFLDDWLVSNSAGAPTITITQVGEFDYADRIADGGGTVISN